MSVDAPKQSEPVVMALSNGLTPEQNDKLDDLQIALVRLRLEIETLGLTTRRAVKAALHCLAMH